MPEEPQKPIPKGTTPFERFEQLAREIVRVPKEEAREKPAPNSA